MCEPSTSQAEAAAHDPGTELAPNRQGYRSIKLEGCEFLIAETGAARLDLTDVYVTDDESGISARPAVHGEMPATAELYQEVPWTVEFLGDAVYGKEPQYSVEKVFLVKVTSEQPHRLDLTEVFELSHASRSLSKAVVERLVTSDDPTKHTLRIRDGHLSLEDSVSLPSAEEIILRHEAGAGDAQKEEFVDDGPKDPIDAMNDNAAETPDVPAVDYA
ncbi:hypothetical protein WJX72_002510 [[Myrmecia] bisecta]|uniref:Uncharacterized protein n=1 Tax=[Myrmecia] bisecta TaxID=41462 RepID=A0AAW1PVS4_9CHLO